MRSCFVPCDFNPNRPIPKPCPFPNYCPPKTLSPTAYLAWLKSVFNLPPNVPQNNPGTPNPQPGQLGYKGFPQLPVGSFVP